MNEAYEGDVKSKVVVYYAVWVTVCAVAAGLMVAALHTVFFSYHPGRAATFHVLFDDGVTALALAVGQGAVAWVAGSVLERFRRGLRMTVLLGLAIGLFDLVMYLVQMLVPATELGWTGDVILLALVTGLVTVLGSSRTEKA